MYTESLSAEVRIPNHPKLGDAIKVELIRTVDAIKDLKTYLTPSPRNFAIFVVGINTAYRAFELLSIRLGQIRHLQPSERLEIKQEKTKKYRAVTMNTTCYETVQYLLEHFDRKALQTKDLSWVDDDVFLFAGRQSNRALSVPTLNNLVKVWCRKINLKGNYGSHSRRRTWGYMQRTKQDTPIPLVMQVSNKHWRTCAFRTKRSSQFTQCLSYETRRPDQTAY